MKKKYIKPEIYSEEFVISETISTTCTVPNHNHYSQSCSFDDDGYVYFYQVACVDDFDNGCIQIKPGEEFEDFCTYGPSVGAVFNS